MTEQNDAIERMLTAAAPRTSAVTPAMEDELARMSVRSRTDHASARRRATPAKIAAGALAAALVLGGAGAAAAATGEWWSSSTARTRHARAKADLRAMLAPQSVEATVG